MLGVAVVGLVIWGCGAIATSAALGVARPWTMRRLARFDVERRVRAVGALLIAPAIGGVILLALAFGPCLGNLLTGLPDACDRHGGPRIYLCLFRSLTPSFVAWLLAATLLARAGQGLAILVHGIALTRRLARRLIGLPPTISADQHRVEYVVVPGRSSFTAGCPRSEIFIGQEFLDAIDERRMAVVVAHERAHQRRHHVLMKLVARACTTLHWPGVGQRLVVELDAALEEASDAAAALAVGDPLLVAESLIHAARFETGTPAGACAAFTDAADALSRRVAALCEIPCRRNLPVRPWGLLAIVALASLAIVLNQHIHDAAEALFQLLGA